MNTQRTIWHTAEQGVEVLDQRFLPHQVIVRRLSHSQEVVSAIQDMVVRGAPLIGATAAFGVFFAFREASKLPNSAAYVERQIASLRQSRPTAVNLFWAIERQLQAIASLTDGESKLQQLWATALQIVEDDVATCFQIGQHGLPLIANLSAQKAGEVVHILTHCNAGRLGCIEWGTATAPIYLAHKQGIKVHVWVDETRPRNQGASLTAWELAQAGIPHTLIVDNTGGHLMQHRKVDMCIVGTDRTTRKGDVANKIGTYLKALAAADNAVPFYVALPSTTIDWGIHDGIKEIPIEERSEDEVKYVWGWHKGEMQKVLITTPHTPALNYGFDVTPARLITGLITERGVCQANEQDMLRLFPEYQ